MNTKAAEAVILDCVAEHYGIRGDLARLPGENLNYRITTLIGDRYVIKIVDEHTPKEVVEMESSAIRHAIGAGFTPQLPKTIETKNGNIETCIRLPLKGHYRLRIIEFLAGTDASSLSDISNNLLFNVGKTLAEFDKAMVGFDHPSAHRSHRWNLAEAGRYFDRIHLVEEARKRELLRWAFAAWKGCRVRLDGLPHQVIHGDAHDENILVQDDQVVGLVDFGDCCYNPTVCDLAICLAYLMMRGAEPLAAARIVVAGYAGGRPLNAAERSVLFPLTCGRLAVSIVIARERRSVEPEHPTWFQSEDAAWRLLATLRQAGEQGFEAAVFAGL